MPGLPVGVTPVLGVVPIGAVLVPSVRSTAMRSAGPSVTENWPLRKPSTTWVWLIVVPPSTACGRPGPTNTRLRGLPRAVSLVDDHPVMAPSRR